MKLRVYQGVYQGYIFILNKTYDSQNRRCSHMGVLKKTDLYLATNKQIANSNQYGMSRNECFSIKHYPKLPKMLPERDIAMETDHVIKA